jgi:hypothetical protein
MDCVYGYMFSPFRRRRQLFPPLLLHLINRQIVCVSLPPCLPPSLHFSKPLHTIRNPTAHSQVRDISYLARK